MKVTVGRKLRISAGHHLTDYEYCAHPHGHNYLLELFATFDLDDPSIPFDNNMLIDFASMTAHMKQVVGKCDQNDLNEIYNEPNPTAEWVVTRWLQELYDLNHAYTRLRVHETDDSFVEATI